MQTKINYTVVGSFVIILGLILIYFAFWLSAGESSKNYRTYLTYLKESVSGLAEQSAVKYNGVKVGYVEHISLNPDNPQEVRLVLYIDDNIPIHEGTSATLETQGLTGMTYVGLSGGDGKAPLIKRKPGEPYPIIPAKPSLLITLDNMVRTLTVNMSEISNNVKAIIDQQNQVAFKQILQNMQEITHVFASNSKNLNDTLQQLQVAMKNIAISSKSFPEITQNINNDSKTILKLSHKLSNASDEISLTMKNSRLAINTVNNQITPQLQNALEQISHLANNLTNLSSELTQNPAILLRGKKAPPPGPGE